jgi:hypothetical protein
MKDKAGLALLLGPAEESESDDVEIALKAFFKAGEAGNMAKAAKAFREAIALCDHDDDTDEDDDESSGSDDDDLML